MHTKRAAALVAIILTLAAAALYFSPHWTLHRMRGALDARDAAAFSSHVDFPALKEDVKGQLLVQMAATMQTPEMKGNPFAGFGQMLALGFVNQMVDTFVSPAGVMVMMSEGTAVVSTKAPAEPAHVGSNAVRSPAYAISYRDWSTAVFHAKDAVGGGAFVLKRQGLFTWRLAAVELPA